MVLWNGGALHETLPHQVQAGRRNPITTSVWVRMPNLPVELWNEDIFEAVGNSLGNFMGALDKPKELSKIAYARICVQLDLDSPWPAKITINLPFDGLVCEQTLDYEDLPLDA